MIISLILGTRIGSLKHLKKTPDHYLTHILQQLAGLQLMSLEPRCQVVC